MILMTYFFIRPIKGSNDYCFNNYPNFKLIKMIGRTAVNSFIKVVKIKVKLGRNSHPIQHYYY